MAALLRCGRVAIKSLTLAVGFLLGLTALLTEAQAKDLGPVGGEGGSSFLAECRPNDVLVGLGVRSGTAVDAVSAVCAPLNAEKTKWAAPTTYSPTDFWGGGGGNFELLSCKRNDAVVAVHVYAGPAGNFYVATHVAITCASLATPGKKYDVLPGQALGAADSDQNLSCYGNGWVTGIFGGYGNYVDRLGVRCGLPHEQSGTSPASANSSSQQDCDGYPERMMSRLNEARALNCAFLTGKGGWDEPLEHWQKQCAKFNAGTKKVNEDGLQRNLDACKAAAAGGGDDTGGGGGGQTATAPGGTTIYKQSNGDDSQANIAGYVDAGGTVTIVQCSGNWCQISKPKAGWVWGEDVGR